MRPDVSAGQSQRLHIREGDVRLFQPVPNSLQSRPRTVIVFRNGTFASHCRPWCSHPTFAPPGRCAAQNQRPSRPARRLTPYPKAPKAPHSTQKCKNARSSSCTRPRRATQGCSKPGSVPIRLQGPRVCDSATVAPVPIRTGNCNCSKWPRPSHRRCI